MPEEKVIGYCVKCKAKQEMNNPEQVEMKGKGGVVRLAMKGSCPVCGTGMYRILGKK
ncbi:MAG: DUF5679 domain-containing protein [Patescibacteria group bacterium]